MVAIDTDPEIPLHPQILFLSTGRLCNEGRCQLLCAEHWLEKFGWH